jgi:hypothetical protein
VSEVCVRLPTSESICGRPLFASAIFICSQPARPCWLAPGAAGGGLDTCYYPLIPRASPVRGGEPSDGKRRLYGGPRRSS